MKFKFFGSTVIVKCCCLSFFLTSRSKRAFFIHLFALGKIHFTFPLFFFQLTFAFPLRLTYLFRPKKRKERVITSLLSHRQTQHLTLGVDLPPNQGELDHRYPLPRPQRRGHEDHADSKVESLWSANPFQSLCCHPTSDSQSSAPRKSLLRFLVPAPLNFISFFNQLFSFSSSLSFFPFFLSVMKHKVSLRSYSSFLFLFFVLSVSWVIWL